GGKITVIDGPFTEAKELIAGFCMVQVKSKAEVIAWGKRFFDIVREDGESEIRQICDVGDAPCAGLPLELATPA
uniref:YciI family protein n=1 Tax=Serratia marcescens TaxID=615 RepID=UPI001EF8BCA1